MARIGSHEHCLIVSLAAVEPAASMPVISRDQFDAWRPRIGRAALEPRRPGRLPHPAPPATYLPAWSTSRPLWHVCGLLAFPCLLPFIDWAIIRPPPRGKRVSHLEVHPSSFATPDRLWDRGMAWHDAVRQRGALWHIFTASAISRTPCFSWMKCRATLHLKV